MVLVFWWLTLIPCDSCNNLDILTGVSFGAITFGFMRLYYDLMCFWDVLFSGVVW